MREKIHHLKINYFPRNDIVRASLHSAVKRIKLGFFFLSLNKKISIRPGNFCNTAQLRARVIEATGAIRVNSSGRFDQRFNNIDLTGISEFAASVVLVSWGRGSRLRTANFRSRERREQLNASVRASARLISSRPWRGFAPTPRQTLPRGSRRHPPPTSGTADGSMESPGEVCRPLSCAVN